MKIGSKISILLLALCLNGRAQGFMNSDFESAVIIPDPSSPYYPYAVYASTAVPGWTVTGFLGPSELFYDTTSAGSTCVSILSTNGNPLYGIPRALAGNFSVYLYGGVTAPSASISQTATVPASAESMEFIGQQAGSGTLQVSLGGQNLSYFALSNGPNYTLYGADVSAFAGHSEQLTFSALHGEQTWNIDNIQFSSTPIPEPSAFALAVLGALALGYNYRRTRPS
jgi:hypothetical protein